MGQQPKWGEPWAGGRTRIDSKGRTVYVLEQRDHDGQRYTKTLGPVSEKAAEVELAIFKKNPAAFLDNASPDSNADSVLLDTDSVQRCLDDLKREGRSARYIADVTH